MKEKLISIANSCVTSIQLDTYGAFVQTLDHVINENEKAMVIGAITMRRLQLRGKKRTLADDEQPEQA